MQLTSKLFELIKCSYHWVYFPYIMILTKKRRDIHSQVYSLLNIWLENKVLPISFEKLELSFQHERKSKIVIDIDFNDLQIAKFEFLFISISKFGHNVYTLQKLCRCFISLNYLLSLSRISSIPHINSLIQLKYSFS